MAGSIRDKVEDRGYLRCGIEQSVPFLSENNPLANAAKEYCQALTIALFRDKSAIKIIFVPSGKNTSYLSNNKIDLVMLAGVDQSSKRQKTILSAPLLINGMTILNLKGNKVPQRLNGQRVCTLNNKLNSQGLAVFGQKEQISFSVLSYDTPEELLEVALNYSCKVIALPRIELLQFKQKIQQKFPLAEFVNSTISKPKLGILVLASDQEWIKVTSAFGHALLESEIKNISSQNIDIVASTSTNQIVQELLGLKGGHGLSLGLDKQWAYRVIKTHGNYSEIYQRHFGKNSPFPITRDPISILLNESAYKRLPN
ncbi:MAG: transporter substrate-binding domain-containing protein [Halopseudomonas aestusnigri]